MRSRLLRWLLALYPRAWRDRYGAEVASLNEELLRAGETTPLRAGLDLVAGAAIERGRAPARSRYAVTAAAVALVMVGAGVASAVTHSRSPGGTARGRLQVASARVASANCILPFRGVVRLPPGAARGPGQVVVLPPAPRAKVQRVKGGPGRAVVLRPARARVQRVKGGPGRVVVLPGPARAKAVQVKGGPGRAAVLRPARARAVQVKGRPGGAVVVLPGPARARVRRVKGGPGWVVVLPGPVKGNAKVRPGQVIVLPGPAKGGPVTVVIRPGARARILRQVPAKPGQACPPRKLRVQAPGPGTRSVPPASLARPHASAEVAQR